MLYRISEMYVADESHVDGRIPVQVDVVFPKMQCICKLFTFFFQIFASFVVAFKIWSVYLSPVRETRIC